MIKCKESGCSEVNNNNCCVECYKFGTCEEPCAYLIDFAPDKFIIKGKVLEFCKNAIK